MRWPKIIQGGMGIGVSGHRLARAVSMLGQLGVVSGTAIDVIMVRRLQDGDLDGSMRRALAHFPDTDFAERVVADYFIEGGKSPEAPYRSLTMYTAHSSIERQKLIVAANFAEVFLAKEGHSNPVGINFLEKIQIPMLPSLYGAMLAGVDFVLIGAGIPREIPKALDALACHTMATLKLHVEGAPADKSWRLEFDPRQIVHNEPQRLKRPCFLAIVASATLAAALSKEGSGVDGFVVEGPTAGGHNAPPRGPMKLNALGEPVYGPKDDLDFAKMRALKRPFWLAGSYGSAEKLGFALAQGAAGIQVGTPFAFCEESGIDPSIKQEVLSMALEEQAKVLTAPKASPAGFPFKMANVRSSVFQDDVYAARPRLCDIGLLRRPYMKSDGSLGYRCPAEPEDAFIKKGGEVCDTCERRCLCNGLSATVGFAQRQRDGYVEAPLVTAGDDLVNVTRYLKPDALTYGARDVIEKILPNI